MKKRLYHIQRTYLQREYLRQRNVVLVALVGFSTLFFGFLAGAMLNLYLLYVNSPFIKQFRASLDFKSAIYGDGILLPIVNMYVMVFILQNKALHTRKLLHTALFFGFLVTLYFHLHQAMAGIVNWAMPEPWRWNGLGVWHALYMFSVASFLSYFYLLVIKIAAKTKKMPLAFFVVTVGVIFFFILLRLDYIDVKLPFFSFGI